MEDEEWLLASWSSVLDEGMTSRDRRCVAHCGALCCSCSSTLSVAALLVAHVWRRGRGQLT